MVYFLWGWLPFILWKHKRPSWFSVRPNQNTLPLIKFFFQGFLKLRWWWWWPVCGIKCWVTQTLRSSNYSDWTNYKFGRNAYHHYSCVLWCCNIKSSNLWSSQIWMQCMQLCIEAWKIQDFNGLSSSNLLTQWDLYNAYKKRCIIIKSVFIVYAYQIYSFRRFSVTRGLKCPAGIYRGC